MAFSLSITWGDILIDREKCELHVNKEVICFDYAAYKPEKKERRKTNEIKIGIQKSITKSKKEK